MQGIVDRIEENIAVIEYNNKMYNVDIKLAKGKIHESDTVDLIFEDDKIVSFKKNEKATISRKEYIKNLTKDMWR